MNVCAFQDLLENIVRKQDADVLLRSGRGQCVAIKLRSRLELTVCNTQPAQQQNGDQKELSLTNLCAGPHKRIDLMGADCCLDNRSEPISSICDQPKARYHKGELIVGNEVCSGCRNHAPRSAAIKVCEPVAVPVSPSSGLKPLAAFAC